MHVNISKQSSFVKFTYSNKEAGEKKGKNNILRTFFTHHIKLYIIFNGVIFSTYLLNSNKL